MQQRTEELEMHYMHYNYSIRQKQGHRFVFNIAHSFLKEKSSMSGIAAAVAVQLDFGRKLHVSFNHSAVDVLQIFELIL